MILIRDPKTCCFNLDMQKDFDENLKCEIGFIIRSKDSLAEIIIKIETEQLFLKYKHAKNMNTQNQCTI